MDDLRSLLPRRDSRMVLMRLVAKLEHWTMGDAFALDARVVAFHEHSIFKLHIDETFGFSLGTRVAFCEEDELSHDGKIWLIGMRREDEPLTYAMTEVQRLSREMVTN